MQITYQPARPSDSAAGAHAPAQPRAELRGCTPYPGGAV